MTSHDATRVMEALRRGLPPEGLIRHFTVGRLAQIRSLACHVRAESAGGLLLKANYGCGKSHLLRLVRELALADGFAVSSVTLDARSAVRFNRMDQIAGAVWRGLEVPGNTGSRGASVFLDYVCERMATEVPVHSLSSECGGAPSRWRWNDAAGLGSPAVFTALRVWTREGQYDCDRVADWLEQPWNRSAAWMVDYGRRRTPLSVTGRHFDLRTDHYSGSWAALQAIHRLACSAGLRGLVILFDEFEDVLFNLRNGEHELTAFANLFEFCAGRRVNGSSFYAVTPGFVGKCHELLLRKGYFGHDMGRFRRLPSFELESLTATDLQELARRIVDAHGVAYKWDPQRVLAPADLDGLVDSAARAPIADRSRHVIKSIVYCLDDLCQGRQ